MEFKAALFAGAAALILVSVAVAVGVAPARAVGPIAARILFDLGDGTYAWSLVTAPDPAAPNASWDATLAAAAAHGFSIEWGWFDCCGVAVFDVGNRNPPAGFVGLYVWNATAGTWEFADVGISSLVLRPGDSIAWYNAAFDAQTFEGRYPVASPDDPYPVLGFRGNLANLGTSDTNAPNGAVVLWDRDTGVAEIGSTPAVAYGRVYVTTMEGLFALDADSGQILWTNRLVKGFSSPFVFDGSLVVGGSDGRVYRVNALNGTERWNATILGQTGFSGITSSPKVYFDWAYVGTFNESGGPGEVAALWVSNGTIAWRHPTQSVHFSSPAVVDGTVYIGIVGRYNTTTQITFDPPYGLLALDARTGAERWSFPTGGSVAASPLVDESLVFVPAKDGVVYAIDRDTGGEVWRANVGAGVSSPAIKGDTLFVGGGAFGGSGRVVALNGSTGAIRWSFTPNGPVQASITYADGKIFFSTNTADGTIYALNASSGETVWTYTPSPTQFILGSPVVSDGILYAPSDNGHVYGIAVSTVPLARFVSSAPTEIGVGEEAEANFSVEASVGRMTDVVVSVTLPTTLEEVSASPEVSRRSGNALEWDLGDLAFGGRRVISLRLRASAEAPVGTVATLSASLAYADNDGTPYALQTATVLLTIGGTAVQGAGFPWAPALFGIVLILAVSLLVYYVRRRRSRGGP